VLNRRKEIELNTDQTGHRFLLKPPIHPCINLHLQKYGEAGVCGGGEEDGHGVSVVAEEGARARVAGCGGAGEEDGDDVGTGGPKKMMVATLVEVKLEKRRSARHS
jgi:hypothetical protein